MAFDLARAAEAVDCAPGAASGKPAPPAVGHGPKNAFKILWHVGTQLEDIADADKSADVHRIIGDIQKQVNGYYITVHPNQLGYWAARPNECAVNFMRAKDRSGAEAVQALRQSCDQKFAGSINSGGSNDRSAARAFYQDALQRALRNLDIKGEQARGKIVIGQMLLATQDFNYDDAKGRLALKKLPTTYCFLNAAGLSVNNVLAYQEPGFQIEKGTFLLVPRHGSRAEVADGRREALPFNLQLVEQLNNAFSTAGVPLSQFSVNVRRWNERMIEALQDSGRSNHIGGIFFEGGPEIISTKRRQIPRIDNFAEGIAWLLANSDQKIFLLMPGFWEKDQLTSDQDRDELIPQLRITITALDQKIGSNLKLKPAEHAICNERLHFIPGSYGSPAHVKPLPPERNGHLAGTVTGEIKLLAEMRREFCGTAG